jgi:Pentapeptide repeats (8 copies)
MAETLLTPSSIKIFGRVVTDLAFNYNQATTVIGGNNLLQRQLSTTTTSITLNGCQINAANTSVTVPFTSGLEPNMNVTSPTPEAFAIPTTIASISSPTQITVNPAPLVNNNNIAINVSWQPNLARIYGFSFDGAYYGLPRPSIFLVHGMGTPAGSWAYPSTVEQSGVAAREWDFSGPTGYNPFPNNVPAYPPVPNPLDLFYWEYEKGDFSIRFDTEAGPFEQILLVAMLRAGADMADRATPRSGASLAGASLSGASVSGASLSGASLSGASLSGASLSGASLRGR